MKAQKMRKSNWGMKKFQKKASELVRDGVQKELKSEWNDEKI